MLLRVDRRTVRRKGRLLRNRQDTALIVETQIFAPAIHRSRRILHDLIVPVTAALGGAVPDKSVGLRILVQPAECEQRASLIRGVSAQILVAQHPCRWDACQVVDRLLIQHRPVPRELLD